jgi:hypothetical protein
LTTFRFGLKRKSVLACLLLCFLYIHAFSQMGQVTYGDGVGVQNLTISFTNGGWTATTDIGGYYWKPAAMPNNWSGRINPDTSNLSINPPYYDVPPYKTSYNFSCGIVTSGYVLKKDGTPFSGVTISFSSGGPILPCITDNNGYYTAFLPRAWSGTDSAVKAGYSFYPPRWMFSNTLLNQPQKSFQVISTPAPFLMSPANGVSSVLVNSTLAWTATFGAIKYDLQVSTTLTFSSFGINQSGLATNSYAGSSLGYSTLYYWRARAIGATDTSEWSPIDSFTTAVAPPPIPTLLSPMDAALNVPISTTLSWNAATGAATYTIQVSTSSSFTSFIVNQSGIASTSYWVFSGLSNNSQYYWRVNATNISGTSAWSSVWSFTTILSTPALSSPSTSSAGVAVNPTLSWGSVMGAVSYSLQVSTDSANFTSPTVNQTGLTALSYNVTTGLANNTKYFWRVNSTNLSGTSAWSPAWSFTTVLAVPILSSPSTGSKSVAVNPTLSWGTVTGAASYSLQVSMDSANFTSPIVNQSGLTALSYNVTSGLTNYTKYFWRANATNAGGTSAWATAWNFTTIVAVASAPVLLLPANTSTGAALNTTVRWNKTTGTVTYRLQVSTTSGFAAGTIFKDSALITDTVLALSGLASGTQYYWQVNATNAGGTSSWSSAWNFTTIPTTAVLPSSFTIVFAGASLANGFLRYGIPKQCHVFLAAYDIRGQLVRNFVSAQQSPGYYTVNLKQVKLATGRYFLRFIAGDYARILPIYCY